MDPNEVTTAAPLAPPARLLEAERSLGERSEKSYELAALYVEDAIAGRLDNGKAHIFTHGSTLAQHCFTIQVSECFKILILVVSIVHMQLPWWEPACSFDPKEQWSNWPAIGGEVVIVLIFWCDAALKATYMGLRRFISKPWHQLYMTLLVLYLLDLLLLAASVGRPLRCLRGLTVLLRARSLRKLTFAIKDTGWVVIAARLEHSTDRLGDCSVSVILACWGG
jgi:hypothetical protein